MNYDMERSGARIQQLRIKNGLTQENAATMLNIDRSFYGRIEAGKRGCSIDLLVQISELFNVSLDYLVLGRYLPVTSGCSDMAQLKENINDLMTRLDQFRATL